MSGKEEDLVERISRYLSELDGIKSFVIASEGLPVKWSGNLSQERAEEIVALATDMLSSASKFGDIVHYKGVISINLGRNTISTLTLGDLNVVAEGLSEVINQALSNISSAIKSPLKCPYCGNDISLAPVKCQYCGKELPLGIKRCPYCGKIVKYVKCPYCNNLLSPQGKRMKYVRSRFESILGVVLLVVGISTTALIYATASSAISKVVSVVPAVVLGGIAIYMLNIKELKEENGK